jgi:acetolactate synthase regulatory subunit
MSAIVQARVRDAEGVLVRMLGLLRRRGYQVVRLTANRASDEPFFDVVIVVEGDRSPEQLVRQIAKLSEVERAHLFDSGAARPSGSSEPPAGTSGA